VGRAAALLTVAALVGAYYGAVDDLPKAGLWWQIGWLALAVIPAVCAFAYLLLPFSRLPVRLLGAIGGGFVVLAIAFGLAGVHEAANFAKLGAMTFFGWVFLAFIEDVSWVVIIACVIPWVDAYSVWRGPTKSITTNHPHVFTNLSYAFPVPGRHSAANLGVPDLFFFALFLGASARFGLRVYWTWVGLVAGLGITIALTVWWDLSGLPALPAIALGFLLPNADLIWRRLRGQPGLGDRTDVALGGSPDDA